MLDIPMASISQGYVPETFAGPDCVRLRIKFGLNKILMEFSVMIIAGAKCPFEIIKQA